MVTFHLTQSLTGHGCFRAYLCERGRAMTPFCLWCPEVRDDVEHTIFQCAMFEPHRTWMITVLGRRPVPEDTQMVLCGDGDLNLLRSDTLRANAQVEWEARRRCWTDMVEAILAEKEEDKWRRQADGRTMAVVRGRWRRGRTTAVP